MPAEVVSTRSHPNASSTFSSARKLSYVNTADASWSTTSCSVKTVFYKTSKLPLQKGQLSYLFGYGERPLPASAGATSPKASASETTKAASAAKTPKGAAA